MVNNRKFEIHYETTCGSAKITGWTTVKAADFHEAEELWNDDTRFNPETQLTYIRQVD